MSYQQSSILVLGRGGREHALAYFLGQSPLAKRVFCAPGNGGINAKNRINIEESNFPAILEAAKEKEVGLIVVGPEAPLAAGIVDYFREHAPKIKVFGPDQAGAEIESSKRFMKERCTEAGIPTANYDVTTFYEDAARIIRKRGAPIVIKADGLEGGKGVKVCKSIEEAKEFARRMLRKGHKALVIEEVLPGEEASVIGFCDGFDVTLLPPTRDYKRALDGDEGDNTGGMGAISPVPYINEAMLEDIKNKVFRPLLRVLRERGILYRGFLYAGLMIHEGQAKVLEFNCRGGDPETQVQLVRVKSDIVQYMLASLEPRGLSNLGPLEVSPNVAIGVVLASEGYPESPKTGKRIHGLWRASQHGLIFHAGTREISGGLLETSGGRVAMPVAEATTFAEAREKVYKAVDIIRFDGMQFRRDIGAGF